MKQINKTNIEYLELKEKYNLTDVKAAELLDMSTEYMRRFTCDPNKKTHRVMPAGTLKFLKMLITSHRIPAVNQT